MFVNRVGDLGLVLAICTIFLTFKTVDYSIVFALTPLAIDSKITLFTFEINRLSLISFLLF
jgi:NADH:ubiquinone oxidoreductase subunit 5 (subunit L)/multisubunit Na+/H+ antiporter MnhA subunit